MAYTIRHGRPVSCGIISSLKTETQAKVFFEMWGNLRGGAIAWVKWVWRKAEWVKDISNTDITSALLPIVIY